MRLIDLEKVVFDYSGLAYIDPLDFRKTAEYFMRQLKEQPTIEPDRKKGKWIIKDNPGTGWYRVTCSECGEDVTSVIPMIGFFPNAKALWDFCPNCGADMR